MIFAVLFTGLVIHLALVTPWWGTRSYRKLERERSRPLFIRMMSLWIGELWALAAVSLLLVVLSPELTPARIGLVSPGDSATLTGMIFGVAVFGGLAILMARKGVSMPGQTVFSALVPRDRTERWYALALAISAGVCEEILYRGVLIAVGVHVFGLPLAVAAGLALALFTIGHLYQGPRGMIMVTLAGLGFTLLYLRTGSLVPVILLHILVDVRALLLNPAAEVNGEARAAAVRG
ncbi:CPBP family intramembrane glutamic endopeptidase [Thermostaphylospora chromogena]|uniref:CAAX protease self-immunity n=1 Tax=Thermostaphylospora chromogena TaxID=35622 RepID=A0A1H1DUD8_9ACTN|nr:type II CAAX endopeptidase family protein [Thermostaphylospora chromogena]SDQ79838.1 CAAX protease self-immunity [Thermostaphylospora chromogena]